MLYCLCFTPSTAIGPPSAIGSAIGRPLSQGPLNGGVSNGGASRSGLVLPFLSFLGLSRFFWDFPDLRGDGPGIFPISPFPLSRPIKSTYKEQSRKGPRHNLDLSQKKVRSTRVWKPPGLASPNYLALSRIQTQAGVLNRLVLNRLGGLNRAIVVL